MGRILIVDDERSIRVTLKAFLEEDGHQVETAEEANSALAILQNTPIDVVLTDIILPKMSGVQLLKRAREISADTLVIMMTGEPTLETASESLRYGAIDYLQKPVGKTDITKSVQNALRIKQLRDEKKRLEEENRQYLDHLEELVADRTRALTSSEAALRQQTEELVILNRLAREVGASMTIDETIRIGMRHILSATAPDLAVVFMLENDELVPRGLFPEGTERQWQPGTAHRVGECLCGLSVSEDRTLYCADIHSDKRYTLEECNKAGVSSFAALTLKSGSETLGVLGLASMLPRDFAKEDHFLEALTNELAVGIKKSQLYEQLQKRAQEVEESLKRINQSEAERMQLEVQLQRAQKMEAIGTLSGGIAHDFNNILGIILGCTELTLMDVATGSQQWENLNHVFKAAERAKHLVNQILTFSRQTTKEFKPIMVELIVKEALKFLRSSLPSTIEIKRQIDTDEAQVIADPTQMHQVIMNLCVNAGHAMKETGGVLTVEVGSIDIGPEKVTKYNVPSPGAYCNIRVSDNGHGMDSRTMLRIFDPYFTTKKPGEGTGLGLAVVHGIVKEHGGGIIVSSQLGKGSTFEVLIPLMKKSTKVDSPLTTVLPFGTGQRVLVVDDEGMLAETLRQMIESLGYRVAVRTSSLEALYAFSATPEAYDLVVTDVTMPHMTGIDLARQILKVRPQTPIILCTGFSQENIVEQGIKDVVMKPILLKDIAEAIRKALDPLH